MKALNFNIFYLTIYLFTITITACHNSAETVMKELDQAIKEKKHYEREKEKEIKKIRRFLSLENLNAELEYEINNQLYEQYRKFKLDSAIYYQKRNLELATEMNNTYKFIESSLRLVPLHSFMGQFVEGKQLLDNINRSTLPNELLTLYYNANNQYYFHYGEFTKLDKYRQLMSVYADSIFIISDKNSFTYNTQLAYKYISENKFNEAEIIINKLMEECEIGSPKHAEIAFSYGTLHKKKGNKELSKKYFCKSAIYDIKNAVKENASFRILAKICEEEGDIDGAIKYSQLAIDDAIFSNIQFRAAQIYEFYSIIHSSYKHKLETTNKHLQYTLIFISIFTMLLIFLLFYLHKLTHRLIKLKEHISTINQHLKKNELRLEEKNKELSVLNNIKEQYIANFFDLCSGYIYKINEYRLSLNKLLQNRELDRLRKKLKSTEIIDTELEMLYKNFDTIFLTLYPTFVEDFNKMLETDEQIILKSQNSLNLELRIYALIRLGIQNNTNIASFLHCAVSTVYNYRSKIRNKAIITLRENFENEIMKIGNIKDIT